MPVTKEDLLAIADATIEQFRLAPIGIQIKDVACGRARYKTRKITLPIWVLERNEAYSIWYVVHEIAHFKAIRKGHGPAFKRAERIMLKAWGIEIEYARAYAKKLYMNGELEYERKPGIWY